MSEYTPTKTEIAAAEIFGMLDGLVAHSEKIRLRALSAVAEALSHFPDDHALLEAHRTLAANKLDEQPKEPPLNNHGYVS